MAKPRKSRKQEYFDKKFFCPECMKGWDEKITQQVHPRLCKACRFTLKGSRHLVSTIKMTGNKEFHKIALQKSMGGFRLEEPHEAFCHYDGSIEHGIPKEVMEIADRNSTRCWVGDSPYGNPLSEVPDDWSEEDEYELRIGIRQLTSDIYHLKF